MKAARILNSHESEENDLHLAMLLGASGSRHFNDKLALQYLINFDKMTARQCVYK